MRCETLVFSSSDPVYGAPQKLTYSEEHPLPTSNPYWQTTLVIDEILDDLHRSNPVWRIGILRYFNLVEAHSSSPIGEDPKGLAHNLLPFIAQVALGKREFLNVWVNDYPTPNGT